MFLVTTRVVFDGEELLLDLGSAFMECQRCADVGRGGIGWAVWCVVCGVWRMACAACCVLLALWLV